MKEDNHLTRSNGSEHAYSSSS